MLAAHERNGAEGAAMVAAFADLEVAHEGGVPRVNAHTWMLRDGVANQPALAQLGQQLLGLGGAEEEIDLGQRLLEFTLVAFNHAADSDHGGGRSRFLQAPRGDDGVNRLLLGRVNEATGVYDDQLRRLGVVDLFGAVIEQLREIALGVDGVLVAAKRDEFESHR